MLEHGFFSGLNWNYWPGTVTFHRLEESVGADVRIAKHVTKKLNTDSNPCNEDPNYQRGRCMLEWGRAKYAKANCEEGEPIQPIF